MAAYLARRLLLIVPTLFGVTILSFIIINLAPGSPVEQRLQALGMGGAGNGVSQDVIDALNKQYGFDKPLFTRYGIWLQNLAHLDFGESFRFEEPVTSVIANRFPVSLLFGFVSFILTYLICVPLGVLKAIRNGSTFDRVSSLVLFGTYAVPPLILGLLLLVFFAGTSYLGWFPIGGLISDQYSQLGAWGKFTDRLYHMALPLFCYVLGGFTFLTLMSKNSMLDVIGLDYIRTARAKGLGDRSVYLRHALRNALIPIVSGMTGILNLFFAGSIVIEKIFNIDGMGLLTFNAVNSRDYNVLMGLIFFQSALFLLGRLFTDLLYVLIDPRIDFA